MKRLVTIYRCCKCGREYKARHSPKKCKTRGCGGNVIKMTVVRGC